MMNKGIYISWISVAVFLIAVVMSVLYIREVRQRKNQVVIFTDKETSILAENKVLKDTIVYYKSLIGTSELKLISSEMKIKELKDQMRGLEVKVEQIPIEEIKTSLSIADTITEGQLRVFYLNTLQLSKLEPIVKEQEQLITELSSVVATQKKLIEALSSENKNFQYLYEEARKQAQREKILRKLSLAAIPVAFVGGILVVL